MPWGQKKRRREIIQSQMVAPPLAAMEGTTLRLKTATTKRRTRSRRPRARIRWGWTGWVVVDNDPQNVASLRSARRHHLRRGERDVASYVSTRSSVSLVRAGRTGGGSAPHGQI